MTLVLGIGNVLLKDDGAGVHAIRELQRRNIPGLLAVEAGTAILRCEHLLAGAGTIVALDAIQAGGEPGTVYRTTLDQIECEASSIHDLGLAQVIRMAGRNPADVRVIGVEPQIIELGMDLSPCVAAVIPAMVDEALRIAAAP